MVHPKLTPTARRHFTVRSPTLHVEAECTAADSHSESDSPPSLEDEFAGPPVRRVRSAADTLNSTLVRYETTIDTLVESTSHGESSYPEVVEGTLAASEALGILYPNWQEPRLV